MVKTILHGALILLVAGLVAGGIYLFVQNGGMSMIGGAAGQAEGFEHGSGNGPGFARGNAPSGAQGFPQGEGFRGDRGGEDSFSVAGIGGVLMQLVKVAVITALVVAVQAVIRLFKRRRKNASPAAA
jgi:hypothetical protein